MEDEEERNKNICAHTLNDWEHIQLPRLTPHSQVLLHTNDDLSIFPPSNHEGLHIPSFSHPQHQAVDRLEEKEEEEDENDPSVPETRSPPPSDVPAPQIQIQPSDSPPRVTVMKQLSLRCQIVYSRLLRFTSSARSYYVGRGSNRSLFPSATAAGVAAFVLFSLWYMRWQRWRRREKMDRVVLLIQNQDQIVTGYVTPTILDLDVVTSTFLVSVSAEEFVTHIRDIHALVKERLEETNFKVHATLNAHRQIFFFSAWRHGYSL